MATTVTAGLLDKDLLKAQARQRLMFQEENAKALLAQQEEDEAIRREMQMSNRNQLTEQLNLAPPNQFDQAAMERGPGMAAAMPPLGPVPTAALEAPPTGELSQAMSNQVAPNQVAATQQVTPDDKAKELNQWSRKWLGRVKTRKAILGAFSAAFGGKSLAKEYEANAIAKYTDYVNNQAGLIALEGGLADEAQFLATFLKVGGDLESGIKLSNSMEFGKGDVERKFYTFTNPKDKGDQRSGFIVEEKGKDPVYLMRGPEGYVEVPHDWTAQSVSASSVSVNVGGEKPDTAIKKSMISRASKMMAEAMSYWLDENGKLRDDLTYWDALAIKGPARTTRLRMERALSIALRLESGAAIGEDERAQFYDLFMPNKWDWISGDRERAIQQKFEDFIHYISEINLLIDPDWSDADKRAAFRDVLAKAQAASTGNRFQKIEEGN